MPKPLILLTNDDGLTSPGLRAAAEVLMELGDLLIVAPRTQQTGVGRSLSPEHDGALFKEDFRVKGRPIPTYSLHGSPAQAVLHGVIELAPRRPDIVVSGINYGENLGTIVTLSGTVGAALEAADLGIPALAVSQQMPKEYHYNSCEGIDLSAAAHFTAFFARLLLAMPRFPDVDVLKVDVPWGADPSTPWRVTRLSRQRHHYPKPRPRRKLSDRARMDYETRIDYATLEPDSDIYAVEVDRVVSVTPLSLDLTSRISLEELQAALERLASKSPP